MKTKQQRRTEQLATQRVINGVLQDTNYRLERELATAKKALERETLSRKLETRRADTNAVGCAEGARAARRLAALNAGHRGFVEAIVNLKG